MNNKQYNNIIEHTLINEQSAQTSDSLATARAIFDNMGVALPQGDMKTVYETIKTDDYMGWKSCTKEEAQTAADKGIAAIGINEDKIIVLSANDKEQPVAQTASVMTLNEDVSPLAVEGIEYYSYSCTTTTNVGIFSIFSSTDGDSSGGSARSLFGHAFLSFKNTTCSPIKIGPIYVSAGEEITFGTWQRQLGHQGIIYNVETYLIHYLDKLTNRVSLTMNVSQQNVDTINTFIANNDSWGYLNNCSTFASNLWNTISPTALNPGWIDTPRHLIDNIKNKPGYETNGWVSDNNRYGYADDNGDFVAKTKDDIDVS